MDGQDARPTSTLLDERFLGSGPGTRALSHVRSRHPGLAWPGTLRMRTTGDPLRRTRIPPTTAAPRCPHAPALSDPAPVSG
ncbi:N-acetyltransferase [Streptomyces sp. NPDC058671]|uniref:N-acetyltransferase n=1 Tax=Streptomyces sp. NPDC058671 TaxID=3346590 RepID=UPI0036634C5B